MVGLVVVCLSTMGIPGHVGGASKEGERTNQVLLGAELCSLRKDTLSGGPGVGAAGMTLFHAPYNASSGDKDEGGDGQNSYHHAHWAAWQATGIMHVDAEARAAGVASMAYAQATARMIGPLEGAFQPASTGYYVLMMVFLLNGEAGSTDSYGGKASASINLTGRLENYNTHQKVDSFTRVIYYGAQTYRSWSLRPFVIFFRVNLSMVAQYQFSAHLSTSLGASTDRVLSSATTSSSLSARLLLVILLPSR